MSARGRGGGDALSRPLRVAQASSRLTAHAMSNKFPHGLGRRPKISIGAGPAYHAPLRPTGSGASSETGHLVTGQVSYESVRGYL